MRNGRAEEDEEKEVFPAVAGAEKDVEEEVFSAVAGADSGGHHPSGLKWTTPTSNPATLVELGLGFSVGRA